MAMGIEGSKTEIQQLWNASDSELQAVIGGYALLTKSPSELLTIGRRGELYATGGDHLGTEFSHKGLEALALQFFRLWRAQLKSAICGNSQLGEEIRRQGLQQRDVIIGLTIGTLSAHIPELQQYSPLLAAMAVFIVRSGLTSFCQLLDTL